MRGILVGCALLFPVRLLAAELPAAPIGAVADGANVLSASDRASIEELARTVESEDGVRLRVLTVAEGQGESPKALSVRALNDWAVGPHSVLLLVQMNPHQLYIQPGTELDRWFDGATCSSICSQEMAPLMRSGNPGAAVLAGLSNIRARLPGHPAAQQSSAFSRMALWVGTSMGLTILATVLGAMGLLGLVRFLRPRKCPRCSTALTRTSRVITHASYTSSGWGEYTFHCPGCSHSFVETYTIAQWRSHDSSSGGWGDSSGSSGSSGGSSADGGGGGGSSW